MRRRQHVGGQGEGKEFLCIPHQSAAGDVADNPGLNARKQPGHQWHREAETGEDKHPAWHPSQSQSQHQEQKNTSESESGRAGGGHRIGVPDPAQAEEGAERAGKRLRARGESSSGFWGGSPVNDLQYRGTHPRQAGQYRSTHGEL